MERKYFGTDGIRGRANRHPITAECALNVGMAAGCYFGRDGSNRHRVVIGKDTRRSCYMLENALTAGLAADRDERFAAGTRSNAGRWTAYAVHARRPRRDDLRVSQPPP